MAEITLSKASQELGMTLPTLKRRFSEAGVPIDKKTTWRQILIVLQGGDVKEHKARFEAAKADYMYMEMLEREGFLIPKTVIRDLWTASLMPVRERLLALPSAYASRCNPADPDHAGAVLEQWVGDTMKSLQDELRQLGEIEAGTQPRDGEAKVRKKKARSRPRVAGAERTSIRARKRT